MPCTSDTVIKFNSTKHPTLEEFDRKRVRNKTILKVGVIH